MLIMLGALIAHVMFNPYTTKALNAIEFCSLSFTVLIMVCGMAFRVENLEVLHSLESGDALVSAQSKHQVRDHDV